MKENLSYEAYLKAMLILLSVINLDVPKEKLKAWYELLKDLQEQMFLRGIEVITKTEKNIYPGTNIVALIREKATQDNSKLLPGEAWEQVINQIRRVGYYGTPRFSDKLVEKAVSAIGWNELCMSETADSFIRAHFMKIYESYAEREKHENLLGLPGTIKGLNEGITEPTRKLKEV